MSQQNTISTSKRAVHFQVIATGVFLLVVCLFVTVVFGFLIEFRTNIGKLAVIITWIILAAAWAISSYILLLLNEKSKYFLEENSLVVYRPQLFGVSKEMFRYDSMLSVQVRQKSLESIMGYGDVTVTIPKLDKPVVLKDVDNPTQYAQDLKAVIARHSHSKNSLVT